MTQNLEDRNNQNLWNFVFSLLFILFVLGLLFVLYRENHTLPTRIPLPDAIILVFAAFRVTRLFVYDKITRFFRDLFLHIDESYTEEGVTYFEHREFARGWRRTVSDLLGCPWCFSIWSGAVVTFLYYVSPLFWLPLFILALSGGASMLQVTANLLGWNSEKRKLEARRLEQEARNVS